MKISRISRSVFLCISALFLPILGSIAHAAAVPAGACLYALDASAADAFQIAGATSVYSACGVVSESSFSSAFEMEGTETLYLQNHSQVSVVGAALLSGQTKLWDTISNAQVQAVKVTSPGDPLASITAPTTGTIVSTGPASYDMNHKPTSNTFSPGVYCGGLAVGNTNGATFTMSPGIYIMAGGGLTLNSQAIVSGTGVTVYNTSSLGWGCSSSYNYTPITISGQVTANLSAPTSGVLNGILFFGNRTGCSTPGSCQDQINGGSTVILNGALYFKSDKLTISGSNASGYMMLVADKIYINGNSTFGTNGNPYDGITVSVSPTTSSLNAGQTQQFAATVDIPNTAVTWSISPAGVGSISSTGLYTAPPTVASPQTVTVTATSQADTSKSGSATVTLYPPVTVTVSPAAATLYAGQTQQLTATVTNTSNTAVTWTISPVGTGTVSASGLYTAPASISSATAVTVTATSQANISKSASATIMLSPPIVVSVSPTTAALYGGQTQQLTATVTNTSNTAVVWSISPAGTGTVSSSGLYTAPASIASATTVTVTATSQANTTKSASATITLSPPVVVSVTPTASTLYGGQTQQFAATVVNTNNTAVTWAISPAGIGSVSSSGLYAAPAIVTSPQTVTLTATSVANTSKSASATTMLSPPIAVSALIPANTMLYGGQTQQFAATVVNTSNTAVTWTISPSGAGTISAGGLYTAPTSITAPQTVTVTATSQASNSATASATITLSLPIAVSGVTPTTTILYGGQTQQFAAAVVNTSNTAVTWSISPAGTGSISASGVYVAPTTIGSATTVTVTATSQANTSASASATISLSPPISVSGVTPTTALLYSGQTQQFAASVINTGNTAVTWTVSPAGVGSISATGLYTAPAGITGPQTLTVTATSQADTSSSASATVTLSPPVAVSVTPITAALYGGQTQQFAATVTNATNTGVTWTIAIGPGTVSAAGLYTAPANVITQQIVTVTATSAANNSTSASATVTLNPALCTNSGYGYTRAITVDHTKVPNTDQTNFPMLFSVTDPLLATIANGGHVNSASGYDITFSTDPAGATKLNFEIESYNASTGRLIAWIQLPNLSHTADTPLYLFYGNPSITSDQSSKATTWDSQYLAVLHLDENTGTTVFDSTANGNNGSKVSQSSPLSTPTGQIGGAQSFNGTSDYIALTPSMSAGLNIFSVSFWTQTTDFSNNPTYWNEPSFIGDSTAGNGSGDFGITSNNGYLGMWSGLSGDDALLTTTTTSNNVWHRIDAVDDGSTITLYRDGNNTGQTLVSGQTLDGYGWYLGAQHYQFGGAAFFHQGTIDELHFSNFARSGDWIKAEYNNQSAPSAFYKEGPENTIALTPPAASLYASQSLQFTATPLGSCATTFSWSVSPSGAGIISASGLYTAPPTISGPQSVTITATSQSDSSQSASVSITLLPAVSVTINPSSATLQDGSQPLQFTASVANTSNTAVTWSLSPAGVGTLSASGLYTAPATLAPQQTVTVTATSVAEPTQSASVVVTLLSQCAPGLLGYEYRRVITIDHMKVVNTDQTDFPVLVSGIYPFLATVANGGRVQNSNGFDIVLTSDPAGQNLLDFEIDSYNPATGAAAFWVRIPALPHTLDTPVYLWYGNPNITATQENKAGVWKNKYLSVYHFGNGTSVGLTDSGIADYSLVGSASPASGLIGGGVAFTGDPTVYLSYENASAYPGGSSAVTLEAWTQLAPNSGGGGVVGFGDNGYNGARITLGMSPSGPSLDFRNIGTYGATTVGANWHHLVGTYTGGAVNAATAQVYMDGVPITQNASGGFVFIDTTELKIGGISTVNFCCAFSGLVDEVRISSGVRSADWIATEYNSESSPSTFYRLSAEDAIGVLPDIATLYGGQSLQFVANTLSACSPGVIWTVSPASAGTITPGGIYTSPASVTVRQTATVTATSQSDPAVTGTAAVTLLPISSVSTLVVAPAKMAPYVQGSSQPINATLTDQNGAPEIGVNVAFVVTGANPSAFTAISNANGVASYTYPGNNTGTDTIHATAIISGQQLAGSAVVLWTNAISANAPGTVTLVPSSVLPTLNLEALCGAFTDSSGNVIEPLAIGAAEKSFVVPYGATQLQLGVDDGAYFDNWGPGFVVNVNGSLVTVPAGAMPWASVTGGMNSNYAFSLQDGTPPVVAAQNLVAGQRVIVAYQSGLNSPGGFYDAIYNADGVPGMPTGVGSGNSSTYAPTHYMTSLNYTLGSSITFQATATDTTGAPVPNTQVTLSVTGANPQQITETTDSTGSVSLAYTGSSVGTDTVQAQAVLFGSSNLTSNQTTVVWRNSAPQLPTGYLTLTPSTVAPMPVGSQQTFTVFVADASGNPLPNVSVTLVITKLPYSYVYATTDAAGHASFTYTGTEAGSATLRAVALITGVTAFSNTVDVTWTPQASSSETLSINISAQSTLYLPNALQLNGTVTDSNPATASSVVQSWTKFSGPGTVTFANSQQASTTASFSQAGVYVLQLSASDSATGGYQQFQVTVNPPPGNQGWIGSPAYGQAVSGIVPITVAPGIVLQSGILTYYSAADTNQTHAVLLNGDATGTGQIGTFDTTQLQNGSYWIQLQATDSTGHVEYSDSLVTVTGQYKPGRVTSSVTDLVVPATGLAINIQRQYDSLNAATSSDFGYGWSLNIRVDLSVDPSHNVTFTLAGKRKTFYFTPQLNYFIGNLAAYTPEAGLFGSLSAIQDESVCPLGIVAGSGSYWECLSGAPYSPLGYIYTDPSGTQYTIDANGSLQSVADIGGNTLTVTPAGISSSTGLSVSFVRDSTGRITQITDPKGNQYLYGYDSNGNLASVTYPSATPATPVCSGTTVSNTSTYTYDANHEYLSGTDGRCNPLPTSAYYSAADTDPNGLPLNSRLKSVTDAVGETTSYAYNLTTNTTAITYPADANGYVGTATMVYDNYGMLLTSTDPLGHTTTNVYDANHNLFSVTDPLGHTNSYTYDTLGNRTSATYPQTATSTNTTNTTAYNQNSEPTSSIDELGNVRTFNYDTNSWPSSVTDSLGTLMSSTFNSNGQMQAGAIGYDITAQPSKASQFTYDADGNMASKTDALGRVTSYTYDKLGHKISMTEPIPAGGNASAATTSYQYDQLGNLLQTSAPLGRITGSTYDSNDNKISDTDARGNVTTYHYDSLNRLLTTTYPTVPATTLTNTYDFRGNIITQTDQAGNVTKNQYDLAGRLISVTHAFGTPTAVSTSYSYYADGRKHSETDSLNHVTTYAYDAAGHLTATSGVKGNFSYGYDNAANRVSMTDAKGNTTSYQYDARKRLTLTTYPDHTTVANSYDGPGNLASVTDQAGNVVNYTYDAANQLHNVVQTNSPNSPQNTTAYGYDLLGNLSSSADANSHITISGHDLLNELTSKTLPDGSLTESRSYDSSGNLLSLTHFNGKTTTYTYDNLNRLLTRTPDPTLNESTVTFTYTATGKRAGMTDGSGTTTYTYDTADRLISKAAPAGTLNYTYDAAGHVASIASSNANGASMSYTYDSLNRLSGVMDNRLTGTNNTTYTYDPASNLATARYPNGLQSTFSYDSLNRLTAMSTPPVSSYSYQLGLTGNRTSAIEQGGRTLNWSYDGIYRLTNESINADPAGGNGTAAYGLDPVGNRQSLTSGLPNVLSGTFSFNADDGLSVESYDNNGNTVSSGGKTFTYDSENRLTSMNGGSVQLLYDGDGDRVAKSAGGVVTRYLVDDLNPTGYSQVVDEIVNGAVQRQYTYGLQRISQNQVVSNAWTPSFFGYDGAGSVRQLTNATGTITDVYNYDAFGNLINSTGSTPNNYRYRGEQYDSDLGLYYLRARYYNPATGRFTGRDPFDGYLDAPATLHKYLYTGGDPVNWIDPSGRDTIELTQLDKFVVLAVATGATYVAATHTTTNSGALGALGITVACSISSIASKFGSYVDSAIEYGANGEVFQVGDCTWSFKRATVPPTYGPPNGHIDGPHRGRDYGPNGEPIRDYDKPHQGADYPHIHEWPGGQREHPGRPYSPWPPEGGPPTGEQPPSQDPPTEGGS